MEVPSRLVTSRLYENLRTKDERELVLHAYLAIYAIAASKHQFPIPETHRSERTIDDILSNDKDEFFLTMDREVPVFGGVTILAGLRALIEAEIAQAKAEVVNAGEIARQKALEEARRYKALLRDRQKQQSRRQRRRAQAQTR